MFLENLHNTHFSIINNSMTPSKNSVDILPLKKYEFNLVRIRDAPCLQCREICIYKFMFYMDSIHTQELG